MKDLSGALRTVLNILDVWAIGIEDRLALLGCDQETYSEWARTRELGTPSGETLERLSYILGIWKALAILHPEPEMAARWIRQPNASPTFKGMTPLAVMVQGQVEGLSRVRHFLDGWRS